MPPPRLLRPLRPCHPPWSSLQLRWASDGARNKPPAPHGDPSQTSYPEHVTQDNFDRGIDQEAPARRADQLSPQPQSQTQAPTVGWWDSVLGSVSTLISKERTPGSEVQTQSLHRLDALEPATVQEKIIESSRGSQQNVAASERKQLPAAAKGITDPHTRKWSASKALATKNSRTCQTCQKDFHSPGALDAHLLWNDSCWAEVSKHEKAIFRCRKCKVTFPTRAQARLHNEISRPCYRGVYLLHRDSATGTIGRQPLEIPKGTLRNARLVYRQSTHTLVEAAEALNTMPTPSIKSIAAKVNERLQLISEETDLVKDNDNIIRVLEDHAALSKLRIQSRVTPISVSKEHTRKPKTKLKQARSKNNQADSKSLHGIRTDEKATTTKGQEFQAFEQLSKPRHVGEDSPSIAIKLQEGTVSHLSTIDVEPSLTISNKNIREAQSKKGSTPDQDADLRLQLHQLSEQVKCLQERLSDLASSKEPTSLQEAYPKLLQPKMSAKIRSESNLQPSEETLSRYSHPKSLSLYAEKLQRSREYSASSSTERSRLLQPFLDLANTTENTKMTGQLDSPFSFENSPETRGDNQRLTRQIHTQARLMRSSDSSGIVASASNHIGPKSAGTHRSGEPSESTTAAPTNIEMSEQSLLEELFPEASTYVQPHYSGRTPYPKLDLPSSVPLVKRLAYDPPKSDRERIIESFQKRTDQITVLQLLHCSTELTEADFRQLIPKGKHIETWAREGEFYKVIPGRDPLSLERLPFYYLLFRSPESAITYQKNALRLHRLSKLHQPSDIFSAVPPPKGLLEDGEDISLSTSSYRLKPTSLQLNLNMLMKPYNHALSSLIERGGYKPIEPSLSDKGKTIWKVLMHIEGYEPSPVDLYQLFTQDGYMKGIQWPFYSGQLGIHRLRDVIDLKAKLLPVSSANPRAANPDKHLARSIERDDASLSFLKPESGQDTAIHINQMVMNRLYNRWVIEFTEEEAARRFARMWHRRVLPVSRSAKHVTWRDLEEVRMCNTEFLW